MRENIGQNHAKNSIDFEREREKERNRWKPKRLDKRMRTLLFIIHAQCMFRSVGMKT